MEIELTDHCRICLESAEAMVDLFEDTNTHFKLELCCGVQIQKDPSLPSKICKKCSDILNVAYGFRVLCQRSQEYLSGQQNTLESGTDIKFCLIEDGDIPTSPKIELQIEFSQKDETYEVDQNAEDQSYEVHHEMDHEDNYESAPEEHIEEENKKVDIAGDEEDDKPLIKFFPKRAPKKPKSPVTLMCNICGNLFKNKATFGYHMKLHRNDKKYECEICSKRFMQTCELRAHIRVHTGEKPYSCSYCDRKFRDRSGVTRHERTHTNERPYGCTICGAHFSYSATLKKHERVHTGEKPFRCLICDKGFSEAHQMKAHFGTIRHAEMAKERSKVELLE